MITLPALIQTEIAPIGRDLTRDEAKRLQDGEAGALSESTRRQYRMGWDRFATWCDSRSRWAVPARRGCPWAEGSDPSPAAGCNPRPA